MGATLDDVRVAERVEIPGALLADLLEERHDALIQMRETAKQVEITVALVAERMPPCPSGETCVRIITEDGVGEDGEPTFSARLACACARCTLLLIPGYGRIALDDWDMDAVDGDQVMGRYRRLRTEEER